MANANCGQKLGAETTKKQEKHEKSRKKKFEKEENKTKETECKENEGGRDNLVRVFL